LDLLNKGKSYSDSFIGSLCNEHQRLQKHFYVNIYLTWSKAHNYLHHDANKC